jgi:hypothetical protein
MFQHPYVKNQMKVKNNIIKMGAHKNLMMAIMIPMTTYATNMINNPHNTNTTKLSNMILYF